MVNIERETSRWQREVERPYPGVPRRHEWVHLGEDGNGQGLMATPVAIVSWENDGAVALRFDVAATGPDAIRYLESLGFTKV